MDRTAAGESDSAHHERRGIDASENTGNGGKHRTVVDVDIFPSKDQYGVKVLQEMQDDP